MTLEITANVAIGIADIVENPQDAPMTVVALIMSILPLGLRGSGPKAMRDISEIRGKINMGQMSPNLVKRKAYFKDRSSQAKEIAV
jgi:hypothetical protein